MPKVLSVIQHDERRGAGTDNDPVRLVMQYFTLNGELLAERDEWVIEKFNMILNAIKKKTEQ